MKRVTIFVIVAAGVIAALIAARKMAPVVWQVAEVQPIDAPAAANGSAQPQLSVQGDTLLLSWIELINADATLKFAERTSTGWSAARKVAAGRDWFVNWADVPSVVRLADGSLAAHWLQESAASPYAYDVRLAFSKDDGQSWTQATSPHHDGTPTEHGFASLFQAPGAGLGLVWLDGRAMKAAKPDEEPSGSMGLRAAIFDSQGAQVSETVIDDRVFARHSKTTFVALHVGHWAENLAAVGEMLDKFRNVNVEIGARIGELGRQPRAAARFFDRYQDRILFGTDAIPLGVETPQQVFGEDLYRIYYRFLETEDEYFDYAPAPVPPQGRWRIYGLGLSESILRKVYSQNAERVLGRKLVTA